MENYEIIQLAAKNLSKLIKLEQAWTTGKYEIEGEVIDFDAAFKTKLKQKFVTIRTEIITLLNSISP